MKKPTSKELDLICWVRRKSLPADLKIPLYELGQIWGQIFGVPKGTKEAHEIRFEIHQNSILNLDNFWGRGGLQSDNF